MPDLILGTTTYDSTLDHKPRFLNGGHWSLRESEIGFVHGLPLYTSTKLPKKSYMGLGFRVRIKEHVHMRIYIYIRIYVYINMCIYIYISLSLSLSIMYI